MKVAHITIQTKNFKEEIEFYQKYVGLAVMQELHVPGRDIVFLGDSEEDTSIEVINNPAAETSGNENLSLGFHVENIDAKREELVAAGYEVTPFISPVLGVKFFFAKDPAGVNVQFM